MAEIPKIRVTCKSIIKPCNPQIGRKVYQLTTFDLPYLAFHYNQKLLLFRGGDFDNAIGKLKEALGVVLVDYHQLAGRLVKDEGGVFMVEYEDGSGGVEVLDAVGDSVGVGDLTAEDYPATMKDLVPYNGVGNFEGLHRPLLVVQITKLKDGLAIGCAFNHAILDGTATWYFMSAWASICSGSCKTNPKPPFLDRSKAGSRRVNLNFAMENHAPSANGKHPDESGTRLRERIFRFSESAIDAIKLKVNRSISDGTKPSKPFTTFQCLSTHVWRAVTRARGLKETDPTVFTVFADCRQRVRPPLPDNYFGNLIHAVFTGVAAGELLANPPEFGAAVIRETIEAHGAETIARRNEEWEKAPVIFKFKDAGVNCVAIGSSPRFKIYDVDFGWGAAESVRSGTNNRFDGMVYLYQGKAGGRSIDIEMTLEAEAMDRLEKDEVFVKVQP